MYPKDPMRDHEGSSGASYIGAPFLVGSPSSPLGDHIEDGIRVEEALRRFHCRYQTFFFVASSLVILWGTITGFKSLFRLRLAVLVNSMALCFFGTVAGVLDVPGNPRWASRYRHAVRRHFRFLTRLMGKSLYYIYLGTTTMCTCWPSQSAGGHAFILLLSSLGVIGVGVLGAMIAWRKSNILDRVRREILADCGGNVASIYKKHAFADPDSGLQQEEFNRLAQNYSGGRISFDLTDLGIIFNALDDDQKGAISERELRDWVTGRMCYV